MNRGYVEVKIFGKTYKLKAMPTEESYIKMVAKFVDERIYEASKEHPQLKPINLAVLTALNLADELFKIKESKNFTSQYGDFSIKLENLISKLDSIV